MNPAGNRYRIARDKWRDLAERHVYMALLLACNQSLPDGVVFHAYHAYECMINALISAHKRDVPPDGKQYPRPFNRQNYYYAGPTGRITEKSPHDARMRFGDQLITLGTPYHGTYALISPFIQQDIRNKSLYYVSKTNTWPDKQFTHADSLLFLTRVSQFVREVWGDIRLRP